jgi:hypothetical protein
MKKLILLFIMVCASQLYGMEPIEPKRGILTGTWQNLPTEVKSLIITALAQSSNNLNEAIKHIIRLSRANKELNNNLNDLKGFTKIVHMLANKFGMSTEAIAEKFNTATAKTYLELGNELMGIQSFNLKKVRELIQEGADVNYSSNQYNTDGLKETPLTILKKYLLPLSIRLGDEDRFRQEQYRKVEQMLIKAGAQE